MQSGTSDFNVDGKPDELRISMSMPLAGDEVITGVTALAWINVQLTVRGNAVLKTATLRAQAFADHPLVVAPLFVSMCALHSADHCTHEDGRPCRCHVQQSYAWSVVCGRR